MDLMKKFNVPRLKQLMEHGTKIGLKFYGTFTFGGEGSTDGCDKKTLALMNDLLDRQSSQIHLVHVFHGVIRFVSQ